MQAFKQSGTHLPSHEKAILEQMATSSLLDEMAPFYSDSSQTIRSKAYYLTYIKAKSAQADEQTLAVTALALGCADLSPIVVGQNLGYLKSFPPNAFNLTTKEQLLHLLRNSKVYHYKQLVLLMGYLNVGNTLLQQKLMQPDDLTPDLQWAIHLALARMGHEASLTYCLSKAQNLPLRNETIEYVLPDLIYTRQKKAIDFCVQVLNDPRTDCLSPNPDKSQGILCGYRVMELLAPVIEGFPFEIDHSGSINTQDYEEALIKTRLWFQSNPDYKLNYTKY